MRALATTVVVLIAVFFVATAVSRPAGGVHSRLIDEEKDTLVLVKAVLQVKMTVQGDSNDFGWPVTAVGVIVDPTGLIMVSRMLFDPYFYYGHQVPEGASVSVQITNMRTLFPRDVQEHPSTLVAKDTGLGLGFVQVHDMGKRTLKAARIVDGGAPDLERTLYSVQRAPEHFDRAPYCVDLRCAGHFAKPRSMWLLRGEGHSDLRGCDALYDEAGRVVGVCVHQKGVGGKFGYKSFLVKAAKVHTVIESALKRAEAARQDDEEKKDD